MPNKRIFDMCPEFVDIMPDEYKDLVEHGPYGKNYSINDIGNYKELIEEHPLCAGCGLALALRHIMAALPVPEETIIVGATGCSSLVFPQVALHNIHSLFGNQNAVATGLKRALAIRFPNKHKDVVVIAGDGATADIGLDMVLQSWFRRERITTIMLDNEAYANTGGQESGMSVQSKVLNMAPTGKKFPKISLPEIAREVGCDYVATVSSANARRIHTVVKQAILTAREVGPSYIQIYSPCPTNYKFSSNDTLAVAKAREKDGTYRMVEYISEEAKNLFERKKEGV